MMASSNSPTSSQAMQSPAELRTAMAAGWHLRTLARSAEAAKICRDVLAFEPEFGEAWHLLGVLALDRGDHEQAVVHLKQAVAVEPRQPLHHNNLGVTLNDIGQFRQAETHLQKALAIDPDYGDARCNLGLAYYYQNRFILAADCFKQLLSINQNREAAWANLGMVRLAQQRYIDAVAAYENAVALDGTQSHWHGNLGAAYMRLSRFEEAARCYRQSIDLNSQATEYHVYLGIALRAAGDLPGSIDALESALTIEPDHSKAVAELVVALEYTCQWGRLNSLYPLLNRSTQEALSCGRVPDEDPMLNIRHCADIERNQSVARAWSRAIHTRGRRIDQRFSHRHTSWRKDRITIGYLSYDFRNHPVAHQIYPLFAQHDRRRFRVLAFSMGPDDGSRFRREIHDNCDEFIDIGNHGLEQAAQAIFDQGVDILVDLMGHSHHNRLEILSLRPAPIHVGYLGFLSTTGLDDLDYLVADRVVIPPEHRRFYTEHLLRMPDCYQINHTLLMDETSRHHRLDWGLPEKAFVYCSFNNAYKIDAPLFDTWMRILEQTPHSVLWLYAVHPLGASQMKTRAAKSGINPRRLIFAEKVPLQTHLNRLPLADLALDTIRYNGGATTANALGAGLPVITVLGRHWVSRMSASHLITAGMPDLIFNDPKGYEQAAVALAHNRDRIDALRQRLGTNLKTHPLFDTQRFVRHLESGFELIWGRYLQGLEPCDMEIPKEGGGKAHE